LFATNALPSNLIRLQKLRCHYPASEAVPDLIVPKYARARPVTAVKCSKATQCKVCEMKHLEEEDV
jgi:hypothetical protein